VTLTFGSMFSGIGGLDLGLERAGMTPAWFSEINPFASRVLAHHWPHVPNLGDATRIRWADVEEVDLLAAGFPCQPFSSAGLRKGASDDRYLWPEVANAVGFLRPRFVLLENVPGLVRSPEFGEVLGDLADLGYDAEWDCIPAAAVGAPHLRYRVFVVAYPNGSGREGRSKELGPGGRTQPADGGEAMAYPPSVFRDGSDLHLGRDQERAEPLPELGDSGAGQAPGSGWWAVEPDVGRVAYGIPSRVDRLTALGNAVVPQVAEWIGHQLIAHLGVSA
jgi:DNA (cytosine-5)-methyltransferase 1